MRFIGDPNVFVYVLFGGGIASWLMMRIKWLPDPPPPDVWRRYLVVLVAGIVGGVVGGLLGNVGQWPFYPVIGAASGSTILTGAIVIPGTARK